MVLTILNDRRNKTLLTMFCHLKFILLLIKGDGEFLAQLYEVSMLHFIKEKKEEVARNMSAWCKKKTFSLSLDAAFR